jgi:hypothetical protein
MLRVAVKGPGLRLLFIGQESKDFLVDDGDRSSADKEVIAAVIELLQSPLPWRINNETWDNDEDELLEPRLHQGD